MLRVYKGHPWRTVFTVASGLLLGVITFYGFQFGRVLANVNIESFDTDSARELLAAADDASMATFVEPAELEPGVAAEDFTSVDLEGENQELRDLRNLTEPFDPRDLSPYSFGDPIPDDEFTAYLLTGTDASGFLADVIVLGLEPADGSAPILVSLPRDLYVWNGCKKTFTRLNAGLGGCAGVASGMEMLALLVEGYTGIPIDHVARTTFSGFERIVDSLGGTTICVDYPTRDWRSDLDIPAGCMNADGATTLAWVRSRHTEQYIDDEWKQIAGSDFARQSRQQDVLFQLAGKTASFSSLSSLSERLQAISSAVTLDSGWSFGDALGTAWKYRGIKKSNVRRFSIAVRNYVTPRGAQVLLPSRYFVELLAEVYR